MVPFHMMVDGALKPDPLTVRVKPAAPRLAELGDRDVIAGAVKTVKVTAFDT